MPTNTTAVMQQTSPAAGNIKYLALRTGARQAAFVPRSRFGWPALLLVLALHAAVFGYMLMHKVEPIPIVPEKPMMVSLLASPPVEKIEIAPIIPKPQPPKPVVRKPEPKPQPEKVIPQPQPVQAAPPSVSEQPPPPAAIAEHVEPVVEKAPVVEEKPEPKPEPKIEPPRFGVAYLNNPAPAYPPISRRLGEQGRVILKVLVNANGDPETVNLDTGSGSDRLDQAAIDAVKKWRFVPAKRDGQPLSAYVLVPLKFQLHG